VLQDTLAQQEARLGQQAQELAMREQALVEREHAASARGTALEEGLKLAREQLIAANQRAASLEAHLEARDAEAVLLRQQIERGQQVATEAHARIEAVSAAHATERSEFQERASAAERHWMLELDRTRQALREGAQQHELQHKEFLRQVAALRAERDERTQQISALRGDAQTHRAIREQLEAQLRELTTTASRRTNPVKRTRATAARKSDRQPTRMARKHRT
jgi:hypothetical protein